MHERRTHVKFTQQWKSTLSDPIWIQFKTDDSLLRRTNQNAHLFVQGAVSCLLHFFFVRVSLPWSRLVTGSSL